MENDAYVVISGQEYDVAVLLGDAPLDPDNDNVDVEVRYKDGRVYTATFFTLRNIDHLFRKNKQTGECRSGLYFYCVDMILVEKLTLETITETIRELIEQDDLKHAFAYADSDES